MMKIVMSVLISLLIITLAAAAMFYVNLYMPLAAEHERMKTGMMEFDKAKVELRKYREKESQQTAWTGPVVALLDAGLSEMIKAGKAEVLVVGGKVVVNIAEQALYMPGSYTFSRESPGLRSSIAALLKNDLMKGRDIYIGNMTAAVAAQKKGRKKIPGKDARTLATERSAVLIRDLVEKHGIAEDAIISLAYSSKKPQVGLKLKDHKTLIVIENPSVVTAQEQAPSSPAAKSAPTAPAAASTSPEQPKHIPIQPAQPKSK